MNNDYTKRSNPLTMYYRNQRYTFNIPEQSFDIQLLNKLFTPENLSKVITNENVLKLKGLLPPSDSDIIHDQNKLSQLLLNTITKFNTPINDFYQKYLHRFFSMNYQNKIEIFKDQNIYDFIEKKRDIFIHLQNMLKNINNNTNINSNLIKNINSNNNNYNNNENLVVFDMHSELASSGYTSIDEEKDSKNTNSRKGSLNINGNAGDNNGNLKDSINKKFGMNNNSLNKSSQKNKMASSSNNSYIEHLDENDSFIDRNILKSERFKHVKKNKIQITIKPRTKEEIQNFRQQEKERYQNPLQPWEYILLNGNNAIVAPLSTSSKTVISKARDHELLKAERPPYITLLTLVRDAAARLEDGVGTRMDICDLLKDSQYINENIPDNKINTIVSGALDRLHYQKDPCVKYDSHHKLWIYLHRNRSLDYPGWKIEKKDENNDNKNSKSGNNIIIENIDDNEIENENENENHQVIDSNSKIEEIIDVEESEKDKSNTICKIKIDSSDQPNLIEMNEKLYNKPNKKIKSSLIGKKRSKK